LKIRKPVKHKKNNSSPLFKIRAAKKIPQAEKLSGPLEGLSGNVQSTAGETAAAGAHA
jgi:hypothetical protein